MTHRATLRIVHCVRAPIGGIFRHIADLAVEQSKAGHDVGLICDSLTGGAFEDGLIARLSPHLSLGVHRLPMRREIRVSDVASALSVFNLIRNLRPDVLHGHGSKGGAYVRMMGTALRLFGQRPARFYCPHGGSLHYDAASRKGRIIFSAERLLEKLTDGLIFVSAYERDQYRAKVGAPKVAETVVYNGLKPSEFAPVTPSDDSRDRVDGVRDFLFIGMLRDIKGTDVFIRALADLKRHGVSANAHVVGDGPDREAYHALAEELGLGHRIRFHAPMPGRQAFAMARSIVVPSRGESMPYIVLEAIAAEMPILATSVGGIPEIFANETETLLPPGDVEALASAMRRQMTDPDLQRSQAQARAAGIAQKFSVATMSRTIERAYRAAGARKRADRFDESGAETSRLAENNERP